MSDNAVTPTEGAEILARYKASVLPLYSPSRVLVRGRGVEVWDIDGTRYLDFLAGIAVNTLGHAHPALVAAIAAQAGELMHVSNFFTTPAQVELAERLLALADAPEGSGVYMGNSGAEANEAAFKLARRTGKPRILALENSFHGRTMGALALTHKPAYRAPFEPLPGGVEFVPVGDVDALAAALSAGDVAALFLEPIQGEAGVHPLDLDYLRAARALTREHGALLIIDEVQTGIARTGAWFAHQTAGIQPDIMTLAKGLGGGFPIGATLTFGPEVTALLSAGQHGTTYGGNPLAAATALAVLDTIESEGILAHVSEVSAHVQARIEALEHPLIESVRGTGLLLGIALTAPIAPAVVTAALDAGFLINAPNERTLRLAPPLIVTADQLGEFVDALPGLLDAAQAASNGGAA
ncbi:MAG: acetylornithine transaminase [Dermabacter sp.]|nr:acetylornithine transaminase [Dermabacter sp.]